MHAMVWNLSMVNWSYREPFEKLNHWEACSSALRVETQSLTGLLAIIADRLPRKSSTTT